MEAIEFVLQPLEAIGGWRTLLLAELINTIIAFVFIGCIYYLPSEHAPRGAEDVDSDKFDTMEVGQALFISVLLMPYIAWKIATFPVWLVYTLAIRLHRKSRNRRTNP